MYSGYMESQSKHRAKFTAVIPVARVGGDLDNLRSWIQEETIEAVNLVLAHDIQDMITGPELAKLYSPEKNIQIIEGKFGSPGAARNAGLKMVATDWVAFWDSDDLPNVAEAIRMIDLATNAGKSIALGAFEVKTLGRLETSTTHEIKNSIAGNLLDQVGMNPGLWRWAFRREVINETRFMPFRMAEDQCFLFDLKLNVGHIYVHNKSVYTYFVGDPQQLTRNPKAISDLLKSVPYLVNSLGKADSSLSNFGALLVTRQAITALRRGSLITKARMIIEIIGMLPFIFINRRIAFSRAIRLLVKSRRPLVNEK